MFLIVVAALASASPAPPTSPPPPVSPVVATATAALTRAVDEVDRRTPAKDEVTRAILTRVRGLAKDPARTQVALAAAADEVGALSPDVENVHIAVLDALSALAPSDPNAIHPRIRARARGYVQRNPASTAGHLMLAAALGAQGDEEGQLRALGACGEKCNGLFVDAQRRWQRVRCTRDGVARGFKLRLATELLASADDVAFIEPIAAVAETPATQTRPAVPGSPAMCLVQLHPMAATRLPPVEAAPGSAGATPAPPGAGLFLLEGITLVSDILQRGTGYGTIVGPAVVCDRLCKKPAPRPLPPGLIPPPEPVVAP